MKKNFLFYVGHLFLGAYLITLAQGRSGMIHLLLIIAILLYILALLRSGWHYREELHGGYAAALSKNDVCVGFGKFVKGEVESPYVLILLNPTNEVKKIPIYGTEKLEEYKELMEGNIKSGLCHLTALYAIAHFSLRPINIHQIEVYSSAVQIGLPVSYTDSMPDKSSVTKPLDDESVGVGTDYKSYYCDVSFKEGNRLDFLMMPNTQMVVKLYPYRKID